MHLRQRRRPLRSPAVLLTALMAATACGPTVDVEVGVQHLATDILYGNTNRPEPAPIIVERDTSPGFPSFIAPPPPPPPPPSTPTPPPPPPPPPDPCPVPGPFVFPEQTAGVLALEPPLEGVYRFRQEGSFEQGDRSGALPEDVARSVENVTVAADGGYMYDVVIDQLGQRTTTTYEVTDQGDTDLVPGVYLTSIVSEIEGEDRPDQFLPVPPIKIFQLPAGPETSWTSAGTDALNQMSMSVEGKIVGRSRVEGCNELFDTWETQVSVTVVGAQKQLQIDATYHLATQYGGFVLADDVVMSGTDQGERVSQSVRTTLNSISPEPLSTDDSEQPG